MISTIFSVINIVLTVLVALVVILKTRGGAKRGAYRQPIHLAAALLSAIVAFIATVLVSQHILGLFEGKTMEELIMQIESLIGTSLDSETAELIGSFDLSVLVYIIAIPLAFVSPFVFLVAYFAASILFSIVRRFVTKFFKVPRRIDTKGKTIGALLGALEGVLVMAFLLLPFTALLRLGVPIMQQINIEDETANEIFDEVEGLYESPVIKLISFSGGEFLANELTTINIKGSSVNLSNEIAIGFELGYQISAFMGDGEIEFTPAREAALREALSLLRRSNYIPMLLAGSMNIVADLLDEFIPEMPEDQPMSANLDKLIDELKLFLKGTTKDTVVSDIETFVDLFIILSSSDIFEALGGDDPEEALEALTKEDENGNTIISLMINTLNSNVRTQSIIRTLNEFSLSIVLGSAGIEGEVSGVYDELKDGLNNVIAVSPEGKTEAQYKDELKDSIKTVIDDTIDKLGENMTEEEREQLEEMKEEIPDDVMEEIADNIADFLEENPDLTEIDDASIVEFVTSNFGGLFGEGGVPSLPGLSNP